MNRLGRMLRRMLPDGDFTQNTAKIALGTALGQGLVMLSMPLLTRIYTPEHFGLLSVYMSVLSVALVSAALRYEVAITIPQDEWEGAHLVVISFLCVIAVSLLAVVVCWIGGRWLLLGRLGISGLRPYLYWILPLGILGGGSYQIMSSWALRQRDYGTLAKTRLHQGIAQVLTQVGLGFLVQGPVGLLIGADVGRLSGTGTLMRSAWVRDRARLLGISWQGLKSVAHRYRHFPLVNAGSTLLNAAGIYLPAVIVTAVYGTAVGGQFAISQRSIAAPMVLIGQAIGQVYTAEASALVRERPQDLHAFTRHTLWKLALFGIGPVCLLAMLGPWGFRLIFGAGWGQAGTFVRILAPMFLLQFVANPLSTTFLLLENQGLQLAWDVGRLIAVIGALLIPVHLGLSPAWAISLFGLSMSVLYLAMIVLILKVTRRLAEARHGA